MQLYVTLEEFCALVYGRGWDADPKSAKNKRDVVTRQCRAGTLKGRKAGRKWLVEL